MHRDIAEADHALHGVRQTCIDPAGIGQQREDVACTLRHAQTLAPDHMLADIKRRLACTLDVEDGRILASLIGAKSLTGSFSYSSSARATQRSTVAALLRMTSSLCGAAIYASFELNLQQQRRPRQIELHFFAQDKALT